MIKLWLTYLIPIQKRYSTEHLGGQSLSLIMKTLSKISQGFVILFDITLAWTGALREHICVTRTKTLNKAVERTVHAKASRDNVRK
jgi:hypothetical protein